MTAPADFWAACRRLAMTHPVIIDRPRGSAHPRYPDVRYPLDYGYLAGTRAGDGAGVDVWVGSLPGQPLTGLVCTVDTLKGDAEIKLLLACTEDEAQAVLRFHNAGAQTALLLPAPAPA